jgi:alpha-mannosidase
VPDRDARSTEHVPTTITTLVSIYRDIKRIDFRTTLDNRCEDHRLRVLFNAPFAAPEIQVETAFGVVSRPSKLGAGDNHFEKPVGTSPQKTFSCIQNGSVGVALFNRGIPEIEAAARDNDTTLALTLVRSVGWLSREDLVSRPAAAGPELEAPGAQSQGPHTFEYAFTSYQGDLTRAGIVGQAHSYAFPPVAIITSRHKGKIKDGSSLVEVDNPTVIVSAIEPSRLKKAYLVRLYNTTDTAQTARLALWGRNPKVYEVNSLEKRLSKEPLRRKAGRLELSFRPAEIKTLHAVFGK